MENLEFWKPPFLKYREENWRRLRKNCIDIPETYNDPQCDSIWSCWIWTGYAETRDRSQKEDPHYAPKLRLRLDNGKLATFHGTEAAWGLYYGKSLSIPAKDGHKDKLRRITEICQGSNGTCVLPHHVIPSSYYKPLSGLTAWFKKTDDYVYSLPIGERKAAWIRTSHDFHKRLSIPNGFLNE